ncbi:MAG: CAP domain-containing protein [Chloroflexi bacterium]|nr:CAP domain-containing protein [Chloroflexota bacterium]
MAPLRLPRPRAALPAALAAALTLASPALPALAFPSRDPVSSIHRAAAAGLPDFRVANVSVSPTSAAPGQAVRLSFIVYNMGTAAASAATVETLLSPDSAVAPADRDLGAATTTPTLQPNWGVMVTRTVTLPANAAPGAAYLGVYADFTGAVPESNEANNGGSARLTITGSAAMPTPTPSPTTTATPTATPTKTAPPAPTPTKTATPGPTQTATPSPTPRPPATATPTAPVSDLAVFEQQALARINEVRAQNGLPAVATNGLLTAAARRQSNDMAANNFLSHTGSDGSSMSQRISDAGYRWSMAGEIIASGYRDAASVVTGWMNSPGHRAIILTAGYKDFGAGVARSANGTLYWTVDFASSR